MSDNSQESLNILTWNIRSIFTENVYSHKMLKTMVWDVYNNFINNDIICLQETWCDDNEALLLEDDIFNVFYSNRKLRHKKAKRPSGGVAIMIKKHLIKGIKKQFSSSDDVLWIKLDKQFFSLDRDIFICNAYLPPEGSSLFSWYTIDVCDKLELDIMRYCELGDILLCGDLNARTGSLLDYIIQDGKDQGPLPKDYEPESFCINRNSLDKLNSNGYGRWLTDLCISAKLSILNGRCSGDRLGQFTSHQAEGNSTVDYNIISKRIFDRVRTFKVGSLTDFSDHCPLSLRIDMKVPCPNESNNCKTLKLPPQYIWDDDSNSKFLLSLSKPESVKLIDNFTCTDFQKNKSGIDIATECIGRLFDNVCKGVIKRRYVKIRKKHHAKRFTFNDTCYNIRCQLHYVKVLKQRYPHNREIRETYYSIKRMYEKEVRKNKVAVKEELLRKLDNFHDRDTEKYWEIFHQLNDVPKIPADSAISIDDWYAHYKNLYTKPPDMDDAIYDKLKQSENMNVNNNKLDYEVSDKEIYDTIKLLKNKRAPGPDGIINEMFKCGKFYIVPVLKKLFNLIISSGYFPTRWKTGFIINIHKSGPTSDPNNFRGITLSSCLGKLFSLIMNARLVEYLNINGLYSEYQFGFRKDHRTTDSMFILERIMSDYRKSKKKLYLSFIDFRKAFDKVWRAALLYKILNLGIGGRFYAVIKDMYNDNQSAVKTNGMRTEYFDCPLGVRQGDGLSPTLFNVFVNDLKDLFNSCECTPALYGNITIGCIQYADDLVIISESYDGMQSALNKLSSYCNQWKIEINTSKSKIMVASSKKFIPAKKFKIDGCELDFVPKYKHLGLLFTYNGQFNSGQEHLTDRATKAWFSVRNGLFNHKVWPVNIYLKAFESVIKPILMYGSEIWGQYLINRKDSNVFKMPKFDVSLACERLHVKVCKQILRVPRKATNIAVLAELGRLPLYYNIIQSVVKYYVRLESMQSNCLLKKIYDTSILKGNKIANVARYVEQNLNITNSNFNDNSSKGLYIRKVSQNLRLYFHDKFFSFMQSEENKKLSTYKHIKPNYEIEPYIFAIEDPWIRKEVTCFRISAHNLLIERGRYKNIDRNERFCTLCNDGSIETEFHFMMECALYRELRNKYLYSLLLLSNSNLNDWQIFVELLTSNNRNVIDNVACFINEALLLRNKKILVKS